MVCSRFSLLLGFVWCLLLVVTATPDSAGQVPLPGPGLSYGGIPYGSVSGNVAEFFSHQAASSGRAVNVIADHQGNSVDYAPIQQYL